ncbi:MAG TPA: trypsin-like peptidase domain-containing protein [Chloroflexota bacterium]|nr:trypsin-like peptidase domain-containing protein [Chloroflexota bacterium]
MIRLWSVLLAAVLFATHASGAFAQTAPSRTTLRDYDVVNGHYFTQTGSGEDAGFSITDEGGIPLWSEFQRLGGVQALGYPVSRRFVWEGFVVQATQKAVLQWRPDLSRAVFVNLLDELHEAGLDAWLESQRQIPPPAQFPEEEGLTFSQIAQRRVGLLDQYPALRTAYLNAPDPVEANGLPVAPVTDYGPVLVLRAQRRAFQLWKVAVPFARAGDVTVVNGGDLGKEAALYPSEAAQAEPSWMQLAAPQGTTLRVPAGEAEAMRRVVEAARPAVVKISDGGSGWGSGVIIDPNGTILTNAHVVDGVRRERMRVELPDGRTFPARVVGDDEWTDVAVVKIEAADLPTVPIGASRSLGMGQRVVGIGYAPVFPGAPSAKAGVVRSLAGQIQVDNSYPLFDMITSDTYLNPGDSGGGLFDMSGRLVGINSAISVARRSQSLTGYSIPIEGVQQIAQQLSSGSLSRPQMGITILEVTPSVQQQYGLPVARGVLITSVVPASAADAAGLLEGDVITNMDGRTVADTDALRRVMVTKKVGDTVSVTVVGVGRPSRTVQLTLAARSQV